MSAPCSWLIYFQILEPSLIKWWNKSEKKIWFGLGYFIQTNSYVVICVLISTLDFTAWVIWRPEIVQMQIHCVLTMINIQERETVARAHEELVKTSICKISKWIAFISINGCAGESDPISWAVFLYSWSLKTTPLQCHVQIKQFPVLDQRIFHLCSCDSCGGTKWLVIACAVNIGKFQYGDGSEHLNMTK